MFKLGIAISVTAFWLLALGVTQGLGVLLFVYGFTTISGALAYALLPPAFPAAMTGRVATASNVLMFTVSFAFQWGVGAVLRLYPAAGRPIFAAGLWHRAHDPGTAAARGARLADPDAPEMNSGSGS